MWTRLKNLIAGLLGVFIKNMEIRNPSAVYESAIKQNAARFENIKDGIAGIMLQRYRIKSRLDGKSKEIAGIDAAIQAAIKGDDDDTALDLIQRKDAASEEIVDLQPELDSLDEQISDGKSILGDLKNNVERLRDEKERVLTMKSIAEHRIRVQRQLGNMPTDADTEALAAVRDHVNRLRQEQKLLKEIGGGTKSLIQEGQIVTRRDAAKATLAALKAGG